MSNVTASIEKIVIPTYPEPEAESLPMFAENRVHQRSSGRPYPNKIVLKVDRENRQDKEYTVVRLENEYLCLYILPEIGGRVYAAKDKTTGYDFFYKQHVIKPALIGVLGSWVSGGVEFNWPFHHRASGYLPCDFTVEECEDGSAVCWLSEHDPIDRMKGMVGIVLKPGEAVFETRMKLYNRTAVDKSFLWWENAAVPVNENYRIFFPQDVTYVNFHYLKSRTTFPVAGNCVFNGIDMQNYTTDISWHKNTKDATSYFASASKYDFFGGYDYGKECGVVHIGNHHISPGKKMFTWAYNQLATSWENALTDTDGQYAELMAGSYSDNQPNFAWLKPYETKIFSQHWYPITKIGCPTYANLNGAFNLERGEKNLLKLQSTKKFENATVTVSDNDNILFTQNTNLNPCEPVIFELGILPKYVTVEVVVNGKNILKYTEEKPDNFKTPDVIEDTPSAESLDSVQKLYLAGVHVDQYRDPAIYPDGYWKVALERDPKHIPTLIEMAKYYYKLYKFDEAKGYIDRAIKELTFLNERPQSGEAYYVAGLILEATKKYTDAYDMYYKAAWVGTEYDKAMTRIAMLDIRNKDYENAVYHSNEALSRNTYNALAVFTKCIALKKLGETDKSTEIAYNFLKNDPLSHYLRYIVSGDDLTEFYGIMESSASQTALDIVWDMAVMDLKEEIVHILEELVRLNTKESSAIVFYTLAYFKSLLNIDNENDLAFANAANIGFTFPSRAGEIEVLEKADTPKSNYLLGCLYYSVRNFKMAEKCFGKAKDYEDKAALLRNIAMLTFNHTDNTDMALPLMLKAVDLAKESEQLVYETIILMDKTSYPADKKIEFINAHKNIITRDDILTELAKAYNQNSEPEKALEVLSSHNFVPCEGGEHAIADQYIFAHFILGQRFMRSGDFENALKEFETAQILPQNLGAGIWNHTKHIPCRFFAAKCYEKLGNKDKAFETYKYITSTQIEYFSNMHLKELAYYQAESYKLMGEELKGIQLMTKYRRIWNEARTKKDTGFFGTTPFFLPFVDNPAKARNAQFSYLYGLCQNYMENNEEGLKLIDSAFADNSDLLFAGFFAGKIK